MTPLASFLKHLRKKYTNSPQILLEFRGGNTSQLISWGHHYPDTKIRQEKKITD